MYQRVCIAALIAVLVISGGFISVSQSGLKGAADGIMGSGWQQVTDPLSEGCWNAYLSGEMSKHTYRYCMRAVHQTSQIGSNLGARVESQFSSLSRLCNDLNGSSQAKGLVTTIHRRVAGNSSAVMRCGFTLSVPTCSSREIDVPLAVGEFDARPAANICQTASLAAKTGAIMEVQLSGNTLKGVAQAVNARLLGKYGFAPPYIYSHESKKAPGASPEPPSPSERIGALRLAVAAADRNLNDDADEQNYEFTFAQHRRGYIKKNFDSTDKQEPSGLGEEWVEIHDQASGKTYLYNTITRETRWSSGSVTPISHAEQNDAQPAGEDEWLEVRDAATGRTYYYNKRTRETRWSRPGAAEPQQHAEAEQADQQDADSDAVGQWREVRDPNTGRTYYYNTVTHETRWTNPEDPAPQEEQAAAAPNPAPEPEQAQEPEPALEQEQPHDEWIEVYDPNSGRVYYYNPRTKATSWTRPE